MYRLKCTNLSRAILTWKIAHSPHPSYDLKHHSRKFSHVQVLFWSENCTDKETTPYFQVPVDYFMTRAENEIQCELLEGAWSNSENKLGKGRQLVCWSWCLFPWARSLGILTRRMVLWSGIVVHRASTTSNTLFCSQITGICSAYTYTPCPVRLPGLQFPRTFHLSHPVSLLKASSPNHSQCPEG